MTRLTFVLLSTLALAACSAPAQPNATPPTSGPSGGPSATPISTPSPGPSAGPSQAGSADGCPVTAATLMTSLRAAPDVVMAIDRSLSGLDKAACFGGYATADTIVTNADPLHVLFRYDPATRAWTALTAGSDGICRDVVPATAIPKLPGCVGSS